VRNKYADRFRDGTNVVVLDPDVAAEFKDSAAVNNALRQLLKSSSKNDRTAPCLTTLEAGGARRLRNESFFSAPQLKRDPLGRRNYVTFSPSSTLTVRLTDTNDVDDECFRRAVADIFALTHASVDWSDAPHITDSSLARWLCQSIAVVTQATPNSPASQLTSLTFFDKNSHAYRRASPLSSERGVSSRTCELPGGGWHSRRVAGSSQQYSSSARPDSMNRRSSWRRRATP